MFDITSVLQGVSGTDSGMDQIEYIEIDKLDPDPNNFYLLDGLNELAANIELIGLQQPLRVRPSETKGRFTIISGHRRKAACMMIRDSGSDMFDRGVPCIVERSEESDALRELRLIYANSATRVMTAAEISKQAERVEMLLYTLKEEGMEFPGRMRDHVAEACKVSKTKLARLHAIRKNMAPDLLDSYFDAGLMAESVAYELSKHDQDTQRWIVDTYKATHPKSGIDNMQEWWAQNFAACASKMAKMHCREIAGGGDCIHQREHVEFIWRKGYEGYEGCVSSSAGREPKCCANCASLASCSVSCPRCERKKEKLKADLKAQRKSERETKKAEEQNQRDQEELERSQAALYWARLGGALKDAGMDFWTLQDSIDPDHYHHGKLNRVLCTWRLDPNDIENLLDGKPAKNETCEIPMPIWETMDDDYVEAAQMICKMADLLDVSIDYLMMRTDEPKPAAAAVSGTDTGIRWNTGTPAEPGEYVAVCGAPKEKTPGSWIKLIQRWTGDGWTDSKGVPLRLTVYEWIRLPEV